MTSPDVTGYWMPTSPRAFVGPYEILPQVDDDWRPVKDRWVLPGRQVLTTEQLDALAQRNGWRFSIV